MNLPANFPLKKVIITVVSVVIVIALIITGVTVAVNGKAANATVDVEQVSKRSKSIVYVSFVLMSGHSTFFLLLCSMVILNG